MSLVHRGVVMSGAKLETTREMDSTSVSECDDRDSAIETESNCSIEETAAKIEVVLRRNLKLDSADTAKIVKATVFGELIRLPCGNALAY